MNAIRDLIQRWFPSPQPLPAGLYHFQATPEGTQNYRLHLRIEADGSGLLVVNAATVLHLNQTAAEHAYYLLQGLTAEEAANEISKRFRVSPEQALQDFRDLQGSIVRLATTPDLDPVSFMDFERAEPHSAALTAPLRLDCALTYALPEGTPAEAAPARRVDRELNSVEWKAILDKAWAVGIPHITFTGGEPTLRQDLPDLLAHAEASGMVTGLLSDGLLLANPAYLDSLLQTGLDHLMLILQPDNEASWTALQTVLPEDLFVCVHHTLTGENLSQAPALLERLHSLGVKAVSLSTAAQNLGDDLTRLHDQIAELGMQLVWNLPVPYSANHPVAYELEQPPIEGAGNAWLYVEPDGDVLPGQGGGNVLGNLLRDPWDTIWNKTK